ncbi:hypothetical protein AXK60_01235 [Tsukamurella pseudospumae]|uniref:Uncharacterized protein n=2 Tax=Tsukamurella pseudospumae TaxID=239498 RepID=A0A138AVT1_9ACTN|nr:hypothetical protein AXK60_01235 [Tsukamurella pseudospumae]
MARDEIDAVLQPFLERHGLELDGDWTEAQTAEYRRLAGPIHERYLAARAMLPVPVKDPPDEIELTRSDEVWAVLIPFMERHDLDFDSAWTAAHYAELDALTDPIDAKYDEARAALIRRREREAADSAQ